MARTKDEFYILVIILKFLGEGCYFSPTNIVLLISSLLLPGKGSMGNTYFIWLAYLTSKQEEL